MTEQEEKVVYIIHKGDGKNTRSIVVEKEEWEQDWLRWWKRTCSTDESKD